MASGTSNTTANRPSEELNGATGFMSLPPELRIKVYEYVMPESLLISNNKPKVGEVPIKVPAICSVNGKIRREALETYLRRTAFRLQTLTAIQRFMRFLEIFPFFNAFDNVRILEFPFFHGWNWSRGVCDHADVTVVPVMNLLQRCRNIRHISLTFWWPGLLGKARPLPGVLVHRARHHPDQTMMVMELASSVPEFLQEYNCLSPLRFASPELRTVELRCITDPWHRWLDRLGNSAAQDMQKSKFESDLKKQVKEEYHARGMRVEVQTVICKGRPDELAVERCPKTWARKALSPKKK